MGIVRVFANVYTACVNRLHRSTCRAAVILCCVYSIYLVCKYLLQLPFFVLVLVYIYTNILHMFCMLMHVSIVYIIKPVRSTAPGTMSAVAFRWAAATGRLRFWRATPPRNRRARPAPHPASFQPVRDRAPCSNLLKSLERDNYSKFAQVNVNMCFFVTCHTILENKPLK